MDLSAGGDHGAVERMRVADKTVDDEFALPM